MTSVFWDKRGAIHVGFPLRAATINSEYYCRVQSDVHRRLLKKKRPGLLTNGVLFLQDNARHHNCSPHYVNITANRLEGIATSPLQPRPLSE